MVIEWKDVRKKVLQNPKTKGYYDELDEEFEIAGQIARLRESTGLSQREFSARAGMQQPQLARLESGKQSPRLETLAQLADGAGYSLEVKFVPKDSSNAKAFSLRFNPKNGAKDFSGKKASC